LLSALKAVATQALKWKEGHLLLWRRGFGIEGGWYIRIEGRVL